MRSGADETARLGKGSLPALPAFLLLGLFFAVPMALLFVVSFWSVRSFKLTPGFALDAYVRVFADFSGVLAATLGIGLAVAALTTLLGFVFAYGARFHADRHGEALIVIVMLTLFGGYLTKIYAWKSILAQDGFINAALINLGLIDAPLGWLIFSPFAVILALTHFLLPFAILPLHAELKNVPDVTLEAARDLGASRVQRLWHVVLPQARRGLFAAFALTFLAAAGDYVTPLFLGSGGGMMLGQFIALEFSTRFNWPGGAAMSFTLMAACGLIISALWLGLVRGRR
jgi:spermidine/putrescine transport system permease protein